MYSGRQAVGHVQWEAGSAPCTLGGRRWTVYTGSWVAGHVHWGEDCGGQLWERGKEFSR